MSLFCFLSHLSADTNSFSCDIEIESGFNHFSLYSNDKAEYYGIVETADARYGETVEVYNLKKCDEIASGTTEKSNPKLLLEQNGFTEISSFGNSYQYINTFDEWLNTSVSAKIDIQAEKINTEIMTFDTIVEAYNFNKDEALKVLKSKNNIDGLLACYRSENSYDYFLKAYEVSKSSQDLRSAYNIANTETQLSELTELAKTCADVEIGNEIRNKFANLYRAQNTFDGYLRAYEIEQQESDLHTAFDMANTEETLQNLSTFISKFTLNDQALSNNIKYKYVEMLKQKNDFDSYLSAFQATNYQELLEEADKAATSLDKKQKLEKTLVEYLGILKILDIRSSGEIISKETKSKNANLILFNTIQKTKNLKHQMQISQKENSPIALAFNTYKLNVKFLLKLTYRFVMKKAIFGIDIGQNQSRTIPYEVEFTLSPKNNYIETKVVDFGQINQGGKSNAALFFTYENSLKSVDIDYEIISWEAI